jgi:excisionase family DNA binding protein
MADRAAYTVRELLNIYGVGRTKLYEEIKAGRLISRKFGAKTLFLAKDVERWVKSWPVKASPEAGSVEKQRSVAD